jgi:dolichol-phosphate mannosyltransferase
MAACGLGGAANVGVANYLYGADGMWVLSGLAGIVVGVIWNYCVTSILVWPQGHKTS